MIRYDPRMQDSTLLYLAGRRLQPPRRAPPPACTLAGGFPYPALAFQRTWAGRQSPVEPTAAVTHVAAGFYILCGPGLARMPVSTPRTTQREIALKENVEGPAGVIRV